MPARKTSPFRSLAAALLIAPLVSLNGCAVVMVADAAVAVAATTVKAGAEVVGATAHAAASGIKAVTKSKDDDATAAKK